MADLGFVGLGIMGRPMAKHLLAGGHRLAVHTRSGATNELLTAGAVACASARAVASQADITFLMLPDTPDVESVLFGADGVLAGARPASVVVDMSSISPLATKSFALRVRQAGLEYVDAPVSGGEVGARAASLTIMVGGSESAFARVQPLLALLGKNITHVGGNGDGQTAKVANQMIVAMTIAAVSEALLFASKAGADPAKVRQALLGGFAGSKVLEVHGERMLKRSFDPGFRIDLHHKDLGLAVSGANSLKVALPQTALCQQMLNAAIAAGDGGKDHSALVRVLERLSDHVIGG
jgi:2-hydroxy-3-oxopropionate reductase